MAMGMDKAGVRIGIGAAAMTIPAKYENGVFKPLVDVKLTEGARVEVQIPDEQPRHRPKSVREYAAFGMWADRDDIPDGVTYEDRMRQPRY
jgi:predicted DNA-binding antitoxin AbrB/MazE fold protein